MHLYSVGYNSGPGMVHYFFDLSHHTSEIQGVVRQKYLTMYAKTNKNNYK